MELITGRTLLRAKSLQANYKTFRKSEIPDRKSNFLKKSGLLIKAMGALTY